MNSLILNKSIISVIFVIIFFMSNAHAIKLNVSLCADKDFEKFENSSKIYKCNKEIIDKIHINSIQKKLHAIISVKNLESKFDKNPKSAHENLQIHWVFPSDILQSDTRNFGNQGTFYDSEKKSELFHTDPNYLIAEDMYKNSSLKIFWAVVQVFVSDRNDYETHSSKIIDKNFHIGEWEVKIYEIGKIENGKKKEIFSQKFEIVN